MNTEKVTELYGQLSPFLGDKVSKEEFINGMNDPEIRKGVYNEVIKFPGCEDITEDDFDSSLGFNKNEQSLWQSIGSHNPYPQVEKRVTSVTGSEVKRPDDYEKGAESSWLDRPFYDISKEEIDTQIKQLEDIDNKAMSPIYDAFEQQTGRKYNKTGENAPGDEVIFDNIFQSKKAEELRKRGYYEANSSARRAKIQKEVDELFEDNSEETKQARTRLSKLRQEKAWRSRQEGGSISELGKSLEQQKENLSKMQQDRPTDLSLNGALKYLDDAIKVYNAPSKYGDSYGITNWARGLGDQLVNYDTWTAGATEMARMIHLNNIVDKLNKNEALTDSEQAKLESYMLFNAAQEARMEDISSGYNVGKGSAESIPFMAEMLITAGVGAAAKKALIKYALNTGDKVFARRMARALGEEVAEETIKRNAEKKVVDFATKEARQGIIEKGARQIASDATMTAFMPTTWTAIAEDAVDKKLRGEKFTLSDALRTFATQTVETGTERWGGRIIDKTFAKVMPLDKIWGKTRWGKLLTNDFIQSPLGETGEEYVGAAVNYIRSFNPLYSDASNEQLRHDARQMFSVDGLTQTFLTVLPMTMLGGAANVIAHKQTINDYKKAKGDLLTILQDAGATKDEAEEIITKVESADDSRGFTARLEYSMDALKMYYQTQHPNATLDEQKAYFEKLDDAFGRYFQSAFYLNELSGDIKETIDNLDDTQKQAVQQAIDKEIGEQARRIGNQPFKVNSQKKNIVVKDKRNKDTNATVYYSADNLVLKDDGTIDETQSENLVIKDYKGNEIKGKQREEWLDALNVTLANEQAVAQKEKDLRQKQLDAAEEVKKNEDAAKKAQQNYINETVKDVVLKNGVIDTKSPKTTKQQIFVWNLLHQGQEEAIKRASEAVGESLYALDKLEEDTTTPSEEKYAAIDIANANIKAYEEAVRNSIGRQSAQKLRQDAEGYVAILMQRDMDNAQEEERKRLERMAERQRIRQENRKKAGINLDNSGNNSNFAQNSENNDNTGVQPTNEGGASTPLPESTEGGLGRDRGNSGADNGAADGSSNTAGVRSGITVVDSLDNLNEEIDSKLRERGIRFPSIRVVRVDAQSFHDAIAAGKSKNENGWRVDVHDVEEYENCVCLLSDDGHAGIAVKQDGDIVSLFSDNTHRGVAKKLIPVAIANGGRKADFFMSPGDAAGLQNLYWKFGARITGQNPFSEEIIREYNPDWIVYHDKLVEQFGEEEGHRRALNHPTAAAIFPDNIDDALDSYAEKSSSKSPAMIENEHKLIKITEGENGQDGLEGIEVFDDYGKMIEDRNNKLEEGQKQQGEERQEPIDLTAPDVVLMTSGAGTTRQTFVFAKKVTDESGNVTYISLGNPYNKSVPAFGKVLRSNWGELDKSKKMFYVKDIDGNPIACYAFTKEDLSTKKFKPGTQLNAVVASSGEMITAATSMPAAYIIGENGEEVSILKGESSQDKRIRVESVKALLDYPIIIRYKSEAKGQDEIVFTLRDLLYSGKYKGDSHIISKDDEKKTVKRAHSHPYSVALEYLREESRKAFGADVAGAYTSEFNTQLRHLFEAWNAYCKEIGLTDISDKLNKLTQSDRDLFWSARSIISGSNLDEADKASLTISTDVDAKQMSEYLRANPLHQLAVMLYICSKVAPQYVSGTEFAILPGKSGETGKGRVKNVQPMVTKDVIEKARERYKALKEGKVDYNVNSYTSKEQELSDLERYYPEVLTDEPVHNRPKITQDNEKQVKQDIQNNKLQEEAAKKAAKEAAKTDEEREADQYAVLERTIEDGFSKLETALAEKNEEKVQEYTAQLNLLISGNEAAQQRLQDMLAEAMAQEVEHPVPVEPATPVVEEQPAAQEPEVTSEEPAAEPIPQAEEEVPAPEKRRKRNKKETPADQLRTMLDNVRDLKRRMDLGDREVTPSSIQEATDAIMDFISENGDTEELWNMYNAEFSVSPEQIATTERSRTIGNIISRMIGRIRGPKVNMLNSREDFEQKRAELRSVQNGDTVEDLQTPEGIIYGFAIGDEIYITPEGMNADTPIHEYTHLWVKTLRANDRKLWKKIVKELKQNKSLWEAVTNDDNYKHLTSDDAIASEVLARFCGKKGAELLERLAKDQKFGSEKLEKAFINRAKRSMRTFWQWVAEKLFGWAGYKAKYGEETIDDFADMVLRDLFDGKALLTETERNAKEDERIQKEMADIKEKAIKDGTFLTYKGRKSNLPERLWLLVRTENFKDWFGDWENDPLNASKVVDENGEPLVVYHGTNAAGFDRFRLDKDADACSGSQGFYTTDNRRVAAGYTREAWNELPVDAQEAILGADPHEAIYSLFANIRNPWRIDFSDEDGNKRHWNEYPSGKWAVMGNEELGIEEGLFDSEEEANDYLSQFGGNEKPFQVMLSTDDFLRRASAAGFDGCIFTGVYDGNFTIGEDMTDYVALLPTQLKSVHNRGYFSTIDDRIEYSYTTAQLNEHDDVASKANEQSKIDNAFHEAITNPAEGLQVSKFVSEYMDMMEGMRVLQDNLAVYLRMTEGVENLPAKYDIRNMFESKDAIAMNAIRKFNATLAMELNEAVIEVQDAISKTAFYEEHKQERGGKHRAKLTPIEFVGRYLIAMNNYQRAKEGTARGMEEFYERMKMTMEEFWRGFQDNVDEALLTNLWDKIKQVTDFELDVALEGQLITQEEHDRLKQKKFYVPQRGFWDEVNPENKDEELVVRRENGKAKIQLSSMQKARGGKSLAENPLVYIYRDANEAIIKSENNKVKVALYNMLLEQREWCSSPEVGIDAPASISYRMVDGVSEPQKLIDGYTEDEIKQIRQIQKRIDSVKAQLGTATGERETVLLNLFSDLNEQLAAIENGKIASEFAEEDIRKIYNHKNQNEKRNTIGVLINGIQHEIVMPEKFALTAQAFNGKRNTDGLLGSIRTATSFLAAQFTVNNPTFWTVNFTRDVLFVELKGGVEYGPMFNAYFTHYLYYGQGALNRYLRRGYVEEGSDGEMDSLMREFIEYGGNTGLFNNLDLEKFRYDVRHLDPKAKTKGQKALGVAADIYQWATLQPIANYMNELSELTSRFAAFCAIKRMGYDTNEAVKASHNLSVNFNRRGLGNTFLNIFSSITPFVNATIQGTSGFWRTFGGKYGAMPDEKMKKMLKAGCVMAGLPMLLGCINAILVPDDPDDVDGNISEWDRMNYVCFPNGIRIPLPQEIRPFWDMGVNIGLLIRNQRTIGEFANSMFKSVLMNGLPMPQNISEAGVLLVDDVMGGEYHNIGQIGETLIQPSFMGTLGQIAENRNFLGGKLRFDFKDYPEYEMAPNESAFYRMLSYARYVEWGGSDVPSKYRNTDLNSWWSKMSPLTDVNPKQWKSYLFFVPSGVLDFYATITGGILAGIDAAQGDYDAHKNYLRMKDVFIANKFLKPSNKDGNRYAVKKEVKAFIDKFDNVQSGAKNNAIRFGITGDADRMEAAANRYANVTNDYLAIVTRMKDDYALLQEISRQALKNQLHLNNDAELNSIVGIEAYNTLDDAEKAIVTRLNHDLRCLRDMSSNPQSIEDINVIDTTGVIWEQGRGTSTDGKELVRDVDGNVYVKENDQLRKVNVRR